MNNNYVAIMAGGIGSRFWPGSRVHRPKQFLDILGTVYILTNKIYREQVKEHLPEISYDQILEISYDQILCEPSRNNTAPCVAYTAFKLHALNPEANFVVAPSDHIILQENNFITTIKKALDFTQKNNALCTLGIRPSRPDTGYGYINFDDEIEAGINKVIRFTEKPDLERATQFVASGNYF